MLSGDEHYPADLVGAALDMPGAGILAWLTGDQLHPPMLCDDEMWRDGRQWHDGAVRYVVELAGAAGLKPGDHVLDLGCGLCGPARTLVENFDVDVMAVTTSRAHATTGQLLNEHRGQPVRDRINVRWVESPSDWPKQRYDVAWSMNMMYQVPDHQELYGRIFDHLVPGGLFVLDDWMAADSISETDLRRFQYHFSYRNFVRLSRIETDLIAVGFDPVHQALDRGEAARGPMTAHFESVMMSYFEPLLRSHWPDVPETMSGRQMAVDFIEAVRVTLDLYRDRKLTYRSVVARRPN